MKVFPVRYKWKAEKNEGTYYIVAESASEAEEIAFGCIAAGIHPVPEGPDRPPSAGRKVADVWVQESWAAETFSSRSGLLGTGSELFKAKAYAEYVKQTGKFS